MLTHCLDAEKYIGPALDVLIDNGLLLEDQDDDESGVVTFATYTQYVRRCNEAAHRSDRGPAGLTKIDTIAYANTPQCGLFAATGIKKGSVVVALANSARIPAANWESFRCERKKPE